MASVADQEQTDQEQELTTQEKFAGKHKDIEIDKLFRALVKLEGSDLHLKAGCPPFVQASDAGFVKRTSKH